MTPSLLLIQVAVLFLPGVIWAHLDAKFATKGSPGQVEFIARSFVFGLTSYALTYLVYLERGWPFELGALDQLEKAIILTPALGWQIIIATAIGFIASVIWMYGVRFKWLTRFLQLIGATRTYGDEDVWEYVLNSDSAVADYVHVRDFSNKIVYAGWVVIFSASGKMRELVLRDAQIYDFDGNKLFDTPRVYVARQPEGMHIEFPATAAHVDAKPTVEENDDGTQTTQSA